MSITLANLELYGIPKYPKGVPKGYELYILVEVFLHSLIM